MGLVILLLLFWGKRMSNVTLGYGVVSGLTFLIRYGKPHHLSTTIQEQTVALPLFCSLGDSQPQPHWVSGPLSLGYPSFVLAFFSESKAYFLLSHKSMFLRHARSSILLKLWTFVSLFSYSTLDEYCVFSRSPSNQRPSS